MILLADPLVVLHHPPPRTLGRTWADFVRNVTATRSDVVRVPFDNGQEGAAVLLNALGGDGVFPVEACFDGPVLAEIRIRFR
ncbi:MAG: hypothetical protein IT477_10235 [Rhodanobacteraceae bacterium]|nr:hypothetical protein [Rhodanobacteraceae bacterium]